MWCADWRGDGADDRRSGDALSVGGDRIEFDMAGTKIMITMGAKENFVASSAVALGAAMTLF